MSVEIWKSIKSYKLRNELVFFLCLIFYSDLSTKKMIGNRNITSQRIFNVIYKKQSNMVETKNVTSQLKTQHGMEKSRETKKNSEKRFSL